VLLLLLLLLLLLFLLLELEVEETSVRKRRRENTAIDAESRAFSNGGLLQILNQGAQMEHDTWQGTLVFHDAPGVPEGSLRLPTNSVDFARLVSEPRYANIQVLRIVGYMGSHLKPTAEACVALGSLVALKSVALPHLIPCNGGWKLLASGLKRVEEAWLAQFHGESLIAISEHMTVLVRLRCDIVDVNPITAVDVMNCRPFLRLRHLFLRGAVHCCGGDYAWLKHNGSGCLRDTALCALLGKLPALEAIDISFNLHLTGVSVVTLAAHPTLRTLRWQHLGASVLSSVHWPTAFARSSALQRLDVSFQQNGTRGSGEIRDVKGLCESLPNVSVRSCNTSSECVAGLAPSDWPADECAFSWR
jgi:hypothetical protein